MQLLDWFARLTWEAMARMRSACSTLLSRTNIRVGPWREPLKNQRRGGSNAAGLDQRWNESDGAAILLRTTIPDIKCCEIFAWRLLPLC